MSIHVTEHVQPTPEMCREIITCAGGQFVDHLPGPDEAASSKLVIVSCSEDRKKTVSHAKAGVSVMDKEWLLSGLLKYKLDKKLKL